MHYEYNLRQPDFTVENIDTVNVIRDKNYRHSYRNGRSKYAFIEVRNGVLCECFLDEDIGTVRIQAGDILFVPKGSRYVATYQEDGTEIRIVQFDITHGNLPQHLSKSAKITLPNAAELLKAFFDSPYSRAPKHPFYYLSCIYNLLWQLDEYGCQTPGKYKKLSPALDEFSKNYRTNKPVSFYAGMCGMSEVNFRRLFKEYTGLSPVDYRNRLRLENAKAMLQSGEYNVNESAELCGFSNISFFIRLYKRKFGHTPKET